MPSASKRRVRRPRQARARATVDAILQAAAELLARDGWARLTTNRVAERAGVSIGTLYEYFRNKEALTAALLDRHLARGEAMLAERLAAVEAPSLPALVDALVDGFVALHRDDPALHRRLSSEVPIPEDIAARVLELRAALVGHLAAALRAGPDGGPEDPELSAWLMVDAVDALTHRWVIDGDGPVEPERMAAELSRMLRRYLGL